MPMDMAARAMAKQAEDKAVKQASAKTTATDKRIFPLPNVTDGSLSVEGVKGKTLQNLLIGRINATINKPSNRVLPGASIKPSLVVGKVYSVIVTVSNYKNSGSYLTFDADAYEINVGGVNGGVGGRVTGNGVYVFKWIPPNNTTSVGFKGNNGEYTEDGLGNSMTLSDIMILEGDWTNKEIPPYFEGIKSVGEDTGKLSVRSTGVNFWEFGDDLTFDFKQYDNVNIPIGTYTITGEQIEGETISSIIFQLESGKTIGHLFRNVSTFHIPEKVKTIYLYSNQYVYQNSIGKIVRVKNIRLNRSDKILPYEPYKGSKLEIPLTEPLRSLPNGVADEIKDGKVIRRVKKIILNGSEGWTMVLDGEKTTRFYAPIGNNKQGLWYISDVFPSVPGNPDIECLPYMDTYMDDLVRIRISKSKLATIDVEGFKRWLSTNPVTIFYEIKENAQPISLPSAKSFTNGLVTVENNIWPNELTVSYSTNVVARITTSENTLGGVLAATLTLADKELAMKSVTTLATGATLTDAVNKVNQILNIWR